MPECRQKLPVGQYVVETEPELMLLVLGGGELFSCPTVSLATRPGALCPGARSGASVPKTSSNSRPYWMRSSAAPGSVSKRKRRRIL
jgi:hypothetical protein